MDYRFLMSRGAGETDARLHPALSGTGEVVCEQGDGVTLAVPLAGVEVKQLVPGGWKTCEQVSCARLAATLTESRLIVCAGRSPRRARERLVGQLRYEWLRSVGYRHRADRGSKEEVRLAVLATSPSGGDRELYVDLALTRRCNAAAAARAIVTRAARFWLARARIDDDGQRARFQALLGAPAVPAPGAHEFAHYLLPCHEPIDAAPAPVSRSAAAGSAGGDGGLRRGARRESVGRAAVEDRADRGEP